MVLESLNVSMNGEEKLGNAFIADEIVIGVSCNVFIGVLAVK